MAVERTKMVEEYVYNVASPYLAAERAEIDGVIEPASTRAILIKSLRALKNKTVTETPKKHGNIPL